MKNIIYTALLLSMTSFMTVGCTESLVAAVVDEVKDRIDDDEDAPIVTSSDTLTLTKTSDGFSMSWDKNDTEFNEVMYRNSTNDAEAIMEGTTAILRTYLCAFDADNGTDVEYLCAGLGTPALGDSAEGEVTLSFEKETDYAFFVEGALIHNILNYSNGALLINGQ